LNFETTEALEMRVFNGAFLSGGTAMLSLQQHVLATLHERNSRQQNANGSLDTLRWRPFNRHSSGVPVALIGQEGIRCAAPRQRQGKSGAAPATVGGESFSHMPLSLAVQGLKAEKGNDPQARRPA
jgi:hypothetical protein